MSRYQYKPGYIAGKPHPYVQGEKVSMHDTREAGFGMKEAYTVVCEAHREMLGARTIPDARALLDKPETFCRECQIAANIRQEVQEEARISQIIEKQKDKGKHGWW